MSNEKNHTQGPWETGLSGSNQPITNVYHRPQYGGGGYMKLAVCFEKYGEHGCNVPEGEADANARLIAAAPELLEAALKAEELLSPFQESGWLGEKALDLVRAAIAKATGAA